MTEPKFTAAWSDPVHLESSFHHIKNSRSLGLWAEEGGQNNGWLWWDLLCCCRVMMGWCISAPLLLSSRCEQKPLAPMIGTVKICDAAVVKVQSVGLEIPLLNAERISWNAHIMCMYNFGCSIKQNCREKSPGPLIIRRVWAFITTTIVPVIRSGTWAVELSIHDISRKFHNVRKRPYIFSKSAYQPSHTTLQGPSSENFLEISLLEL